MLVYVIFICSSVDWDGGNRRFSLFYPNICLHAVSRDPYGGHENVKFPHPHLFLMVDGERVWSNGEPPPSGSGDNGMDVDDEGWCDLSSLLLTQTHACN